MRELAFASQATRLEILATDVDPAMLRRAREARYPPSAVRELPADWRAAAFEEHDDELVLRPRFRRHVRVAHHDIRTDPPDGPFDLILCRYLAFTYFDDLGQRATVRRLARVLRPGGALVLGTHEKLPEGDTALAAWAPRVGVYRRAS